MTYKIFFDVNNVASIQYAYQLQTTLDGVIMLGSALLPIPFYTTGTATEITFIKKKD